MAKTKFTNSKTNFILQEKLEKDIDRIINDFAKLKRVSEKH